MSFFNDSNDLAAQLCWGRYYQSDAPCPKVEKIAFTRDEDEVVITDNGTDWAKIASCIQALLRQGYNYTLLPSEYCGATEMEDMLCCDECGEGIVHGRERAYEHEGEKGTVCARCEIPAKQGDVDEL